MKSAHKASKRPGKASPAGKKPKPRDALERSATGLIDAQPGLPGFPGEGLRGREWVQAEERMSELIGANLPQTKYHALASFALCCREIDPQWPGVGFPAAPGVLRGSQEIVEIEIWRAVKRRDEAFFADLARFAKKLFRPDWMSNEERILWEAMRLLEKNGANPTREEVKQAVIAKGVRIEERDWSGYFKRCGLGFLSKGKPGRKAGRPIKRPSR